MTKNPTITVFMPVYNGERFIRDAIASILQQSFEDFELLIINDASTDRTVKIVETYTDPRIKLIHNETNLSVCPTRNRGLDLARGKYIACLDSDDISFPTRLEKQKIFLDDNQNIALVGSWAEIIDKNGNSQGIKTFLTDSPLIKWKLLFCNTFINSSIMFRKNSVLSLQGYDPAYDSTEDYDLCSRISFQHELTNIPEVLVKWRTWEGNLTSSRTGEQKELARKISRRNLQHVWGETVDIRVLESFKLLYSGVKADFSNKRMNELVSHRNVLIDRFIEKYNYEDRSVVKNLRVEITTHLFSLIIRANNTWPVKLKQLFVWLVKTKPNIVRAFYIFLFKRTIFGSRIRKLFYIK
jgi:glycosyltransferase involved in cell wall biosynthesis